MDMQTLGRFLLVLAVAIAIVGALMVVGGRFGLGSLPGDIRIQTPRGSCFFPIVTSIVLSLLLTIILNVVLRWFR
jgi:hypothetical protein